MRIQIQTRGFDLTPAIESHVRKQVERSLGNSKNHVVATQVFLSDINGPRGGCDKKALICVQLDHKLSVSLECVHEDLYHAVSAAARQARRAVKRNLRKHARQQKALLRELRCFPEGFTHG